MRLRWPLLGLGVAVAAVCAAGPAPPAAPPPPPPTDESLIEFLGADDVGDASWWEFLKSADPNSAPPPPPPQSAKQ